MSVQDGESDNREFRRPQPGDDDTEIRKLVQYGTGESLYVNAPLEAVTKLGLAKGEPVMVTYDEDGIHITPFK